jgi:hypothetical protein
MVVALRFIAAGLRPAPHDLASDGDVVLDGNGDSREWKMLPRGHAFLHLVGLTTGRIGAHRGERRENGIVSRYPSERVLNGVTY